MTKQAIIERIKARIVKLIRRQKETLDDYKDEEDWGMQGILAERNVNYQFEIKFLNELLK